MSDSPVLGGALATGVRVSTVAGNGESGLVNGPAAEARFKFPIGLVMDPAGNLLVADTDNHVIRRITPDGMVSTLAGDGVGGYVDGPAAQARFQYPRDLALDTAGNLYVVDTDNHCIRKITPAGVVSTFAGNGTRGYADGARTYARFGYPNGIDVDGAGNFYVSDPDNARIRKISPGGTVSTLAGNGPRGYADAQGKAARFSSPRGVTVVSDGTVYVADYGNSRIRKIDPQGNVSTYAGDGQGGYVDDIGTYARFADPCNVEVDALGNLIVSDTENHCIRQIAPDGTVTTLAGNGTAAEDLADGPGPNARFNWPRGLAITPTGTIYLADTRNHCIRRIDR